ncbi:TrmH family RNA methyltransferase [Bacillus marinisedimentorum]|uniref:TrmH family RNA methyltransferase n=1 Tax=Bacillus marinisedimentorum TaxID=1821260 RepID=UPI000871F82E|nr:RNA methyltransferase [Bacillus marinisedimentorum]
MKRIESPKNPFAKQLKKLHTKKEREKSGTFLIEGWHLVEEAIVSKTGIVQLVISEDESFPAHWDVSGMEIIYASPEVMKSISDMESPQGVAAVCTIEEKQPVQFKKLLFIDGVQDPGNVGTLIRTADAAGLDGVILGKGSADLYNSKVLRSTQGSIFHLPVVRADLQDWIAKVRSNGMTIYGSSLKDASNYREMTAERPYALIVGNEGSGVTPELLAQTDQNLYIPISGKAESLNVTVAAGILLFHLK